MLNEQEIQDELLDRLVDGELLEDDYRQLVQRLEHSPDGWRRCALSFLEQQALQRELTQLLRDGSRLELIDDCLAEPDLDDIETLPVGAVAQREHWVSSPWVRWSSVVAVGLLAFVGGIALRPFEPSTIVGEQSFAKRGLNEATDAAFPSVVSANPKSNPDLATFVIEGASAGQLQPFQVPVMPIANNVGGGIPKFASEQFSPQIVDVLGDSANPDQLERRLLLLRDQEGGVIIFPVDSIVQNSHFQ